MMPSIGGISGCRLSPLLSERPFPGRLSPGVLEKAMALVAAGVKSMRNPATSGQRTCDLTGMQHQEKEAAGDSDAVRVELSAQGVVMRHESVDGA